MTRRPEDLSHALIEAALKAGADAADAMTIKATGMSIDVRGGALERAERAEGMDVGLRVFVGQKTAITSASASEARPEAVAAMADRAVAMAREAPEDPHVGLADPDRLATDWDTEALELADPSAEPDPAALEADAREAEAAALAFDGITQVSTASAGYARHEMHIAATNGFSGGYGRTSRSIGCVAIAGEGLGMERDYDGDSRVHQSDLRPASELGASAARRALERLDPRKPKTGAYPVLFDERVAASLIGHLVVAINGASIARGASWLRDARGEEVLPPHLSLIEDPHRRRVSGSRPFDAEGLPTRPRAVVDRGALTGWTLDLATARKLGLESTANAARAVSGGVSPSAWNLSLSPGDESREALMKHMGTGLLVTSMIGATINPNTGDYSRGAAGHWVEGGEIAYPVSGVTIAGNLREMLRTIRPANDARPHLSRVVPSLLVEGLTLAGS